MDLEKGQNQYEASWSLTKPGRCPKQEMFLVAKNGEILNAYQTSIDV